MPLVSGVGRGSATAQWCRHRSATGQWCRHMYSATGRCRNVLKIGHRERPTKDARQQRNEKVKFLRQ